MVPSEEALHELDSERHARQIADEGADRARHAGLDAKSAPRRGTGPGEIVAVLLDVAAEHRAQVIVVGRRGLGRVPAAILGSVSDALVREAPLPVIVVPGQDRKKRPRGLHDWLFGAASLG